MEHIGLFAPRNCTGNSGDIGDTILQTSLVRTLLDRSVFPDLVTVHWWGTKWVVDRLFGYFDDHVRVYDWKGDQKDLPSASEVHTLSIQALLVCTRNEEVLTKFGQYDVPFYGPTSPLDANSSVHLCSQLHSCLRGLGIHVTDLPSPRILITHGEVERAKRQLTERYLRENSAEWVDGKTNFSPDGDRSFLVTPAVGDDPDDRTWSRDEWKELVRRLSGVGMVVVGYNPKQHDEQRAAEYIVGGARGFKPRCALGIPLRRDKTAKPGDPEGLGSFACASTVAIARDSGPMHVTAATVGPAGRPCVLGLVSVMNPATWVPLSPTFESMGRWPLPLSEAATPNDVTVRAATLAQTRCR